MRRLSLGDSPGWIVVDTGCWFVVTTGTTERRRGVVKIHRSGCVVDRYRVARVGRRRVVTIRAFVVCGKERRLSVHLRVDFEWRRSDCVSGFTLRVGRFTTTQNPQTARGCESFEGVCTDPPVRRRLLSCPHRGRDCFSGVLLTVSRRCDDAFSEPRRCGAGTDIEGLCMREWLVLRIAILLGMLAYSSTCPCSSC